jgi:hypothetical protein
VWFELLQDDIGRYLEEDVWHKEDCQCNVVLRRTWCNFQIFSEAKDDGIRNIRPIGHPAISNDIDKKFVSGRGILPVQKGEQVQDAQTWYQTQVDLGHEASFCGVARHGCLLAIIPGDTVRMVGIAVRIVRVFASMGTDRFVPFLA